MTHGPPEWLGVTQSDWNTSLSRCMSLSLAGSAHRLPTLAVPNPFPSTRSSNGYEVYVRVCACGGAGEGVRERRRWARLGPA